MFDQRADLTQGTCGLNVRKTTGSQGRRHLSWWQFLGATLLLATGAYPDLHGQATFSPDKAFRALLSANSAFYARRWPEAETAFEYRLSLAPTDGSSYFELGEVRYLLKDYRGAIDAFQHARVLGFDVEESDKNIASMHGLMGDGVAAAAALSVAVRAGATGIASLVAGADFAKVQMDPVWRATVDSLAPNYPELDPAGRRGDSLITQKNWHAAAVAYDEVLGRHPNDGRAWYRYGLIQYYNHEYESAIRAFIRAADLPYDRVNSLYNLASSYAVSNDRANALATVRRTLAAGYVDVAALSADNDFAALHSDPQWKSLIDSSRLASVGAPPALPPRARDYWPTTEWRTRSAAAVGLDSGRLARAAQALSQENPDATSLLVLRHGYLVYERYFHGQRAADAVNVKSVTKSVTSALIGIAIHDGLIRSVDQPVAELLPASLVAGMDSTKRAITVRHLLSMTSGLRWTENGTETSQWQTSGDPGAYSLALKMNAPAGERYNYSTANYHLLSIALSHASGISTYEFAMQHLFAPIGIAPSSWNRDPQGYFNGGSELRLTSREMAKVGFLYLNGGRWNGKQVVPQDWVIASTGVQAPQSNDFAGYGFGWRPWNARGHAAFFALGFGGQYIVVIPDLDMVVVITARVSNPRSELRQYIVGDILPALENGSSTPKAPD